MFFLQKFSNWVIENSIYFYEIYMRVVRILVGGHLAEGLVNKAHSKVYTKVKGDNFLDFLNLLRYLIFCKYSSVHMRTVSTRYMYCRVLVHQK